MGAVDAVTIAQAADLLGVSKPRVHQLLRSGILTGPSVGPGRAPANAGRVWQSSVDAEARRRQGAATPASRTQRRGVGSKRRAPAATAGQNTAPRSRPPRSDAAAVGAFAATQHMKIALDLAREALRAERAQTRRVTRSLADTVALLQNQQRLADEADAIADGYANALTQLLTPGDPSGA